MGIKKDESCMRKYLNKVSVIGLKDPDYVTAGASLLYFLAVYQENMAA